MKYAFIIISILLLGGRVQAQAPTWDELFNQKQTQTRYLIDQVVALQVYIGFVRDTYSIAKKGLNFISDVTSGELFLHNDFFQSLIYVNPQVRKYSRVADIISLQTQILRTYNGHIKMIRNGGMLQANELEYVQNVFGRVLQDCTGILDDMADIISSRKLEMKDDERIARIDELYFQMQQNFAFTKSFASGTVQLSIAREGENISVGNSRILNNK